MLDEYTVTTEAISNVPLAELLEALLLELLEQGSPHPCTDCTQPLG